jgi:anti-anti-sigma factor
LRIENTGIDVKARIQGDRKLGAGDPPAVQMEIKKTQTGDSIEFKISGRLDAYWSDHLANEISAAIRSGVHHVKLDLTELMYISSAGIRVLLSFYQQLKSIQGKLTVTQTSKSAREVLEMAGLLDLLTPAVHATQTIDLGGEKSETAKGRFEIFRLQMRASLNCIIYGNPALLEGCRYGEANAKKIKISANSFGLGLGAFGSQYEECRDRFGEFLAVAGTAAYFPTDGTNVPDYLVSSGKFVPELIVLYGMFCEGAWNYLIRFETTDRSIPLSEILSFSFERTKHDSLGIVMVCESAGLVGAALNKPPVDAVSKTAPYGFPEAVDWLSFTAERVHTRSVALVAGLATRKQEAQSILRPMYGSVSGHFHAAAFPYRPLKKGRLDLNETVAALYESNLVEGVLHLIPDDRELGTGESEFVRGACWISPISSFVEEQ